MSLAGKRLMLVGGAGFVGSHIVDQLLQTDVAEVLVYGSLRSAARNLPHTDQRLRFIEGSVTDSDRLKEALKGVDGVFLLASRWLKECAADPRAGFDVNVLGGFNVLEACRQNGVRRIVYASSTAVYGSPLRDPTDEDHALNGSSFYGATKIAVEQFLRAYQQQYGLSYAICRLSNVYGPRQAAKGDATSVIIRFLDCIDAGEAPIIFGSGEQSYDFIYVADAARAMILAMQADETEAEVLNIASGESTSLNTLVRLMLDLSGSALEPDYRPQAQTSSPGATLGVDRARHLLGFQAQTGLADGLYQMIQWRITEKDKHEA